jgi:CRP/FNR family transcriptional regulator, cyclic AMP receptor protein
MSRPAQALATAAWAALLTPERRSRVEQDTVSREMPEGSYVCRKGDTASYWNGVLIGLIKVATVSPSGKLTTFSGVPAGGWFGEGSICKEEAWRFDAIALRDSEVAYTPRSTFLWLLESNARFARFLLVHVNERLAQAMGLIECARLLGPDRRVAHCLASMFNPTLYPGMGSVLRISQEEIGHLVGLSRPRVNQALKLLQERELLRIERVGISILDLERPRRFEN